MGHSAAMTETSLRAAPRVFRGPGGTGLPNLVGLRGVHGTDEIAAQTTETERFDTADLGLAAAGITLALHRDVDPPAQWRLDLPDGDGIETLRVPSASDNPSDVPGELLELIRGAARGREVGPVGRTRTVRKETRLLGDADRVLASLVHREVTLGRAADLQSWTEIEVVITDGNALLLDAVVGRLRELGLRPAASDAAAELDRMLRPAHRGRRPGRKGSAGAVLMDYVARQTERLGAEEARVRQGAPDAVHQMRIAARRLRSVLQAYRVVLDQTRTGPVARDLRDLGRQLAPARDAEVLRERIDADLAALPTELLLGPVRAEATRHFARTEGEARAAVLTALDSPEHLALLDALDDLVEHPPLARRAGRRAAKTLSAHRTAKRLRAAMTTALGSDAAHQDATLHSARKAAKRLRYAVEVTGERPRGLKSLQKALGRHQDAVMARSVLRELGATAENGFSFGVLRGLEDARAAAVEAELPRLWKRARAHIG